MNHHHSFYDCPLRNSLLLVVHRQQQIIVTATDEVFNILNYKPYDLLGKSIKQLSPHKGIRWTLKHATQGPIPFDICIHRDPFSTGTTHLDYWLIRPITALTTLTTTSSFSILSLNSYGTIEQAQLSFDFPQSKRNLIGCPIMSFIHEADVRLLCTNLSQMQSRLFSSFSIRWIQDPSKHTYCRLTITVIHVPDKKRLGDSQIWPICILRPEQLSTPCLSPSIVLNYLVSNSKLFIHLMKQWIGHASQIATLAETIVEALHTAFIHGRLYLLEFLVHATISISSTMQEWLGDSNQDNEVYTDSLSSHITYNAHRHRRRSKKKEQRELKRGSRLIINVSTEACVWPVPLFHSHQPYVKK
ncbi:hypothetical protein BD560DRAFT_411657 [Blakeslea trispora]|nr:hypothetical protein BD560DRAFT_411657 [Blakeslea trispora]